MKYLKTRRIWEDIKTFYKFMDLVQYYICGKIPCTMHVGIIPTRVQNTDPCLWGHLVTYESSNASNVEAWSSRTVGQL